MEGSFRHRFGDDLVPHVCFAVSVSSNVPSLCTNGKFSFPCKGKTNSAMKISLMVKKRNQTWTLCRKGEVAR